MEVDTINMIIKNIMLNIFSFIIFLKFSNYKKTNLVKIIELLISAIFLSFVYFFFKNKFDIVIAIFIICILQMLVLKIINRQKTSVILIGTIISISLSYVFLTISTIIEFFFQRICSIDDKLINAIITLIIESILIYYFLKIKKFKNGLTFLQKTDEYMEIAVINISVFSIILYGLLGSNYKKVIENLLVYFIILVIFMIITIQKILVMHYKQKLIDDTINDYKKQLQEKDDEIKKLTDEAFRVSKVTHEFYNRQKSLELMVKKKLENFNVEMAEDFDVLDRIHQITAEHSERINDIKSVAELPVTNIEEIDNMFEYMQSECVKYGINFKLMVNGNINYLVNNLIPKNKLETLIGDHIRDAIIAVNSSDRAHKEIFVVLGVKDNCYELCIYDTGIEFEIDTLLKLGLMPITTHKDSGGSGIGFITTFETLKECKASLIIEEKNSGVDNGYTKAVIIRFDGENEYRISSYRASEIKKYVKDNRIKII